MRDSSENARSKDLRPLDKALPGGQIRRGDKVFGCHLDLMEGEVPDGCVIEYSLDDCNFGRYGNGKPRRSRWTCPHWKPVSDRSPIN